MLATAQTCAVLGLDGYIVHAEVDISPGLPAFNIVGLPDTAVQEAKERVRPALRNSGCEFPLRRITVNLAPADLKKEGLAYDLPIAVGMMVSSGQVDLPDENAIYLGELSLDGNLRHTTGILSMISVLRDQGFTKACAGSGCPGIRFGGRRGSLSRPRSRRSDRALPGREQNLSHLDERHSHGR